MSLKASLKAINQPKHPAKRVSTVNNVIAKFGENLVHIVAELNKRGKLHGIDHFVNLRYHPVERILWFALVIAAFCGVFFIGKYQMERYVANPTVISIERGTFRCSIKILFVTLSRGLQIKFILGFHVSLCLFLLFIRFNQTRLESGLEWEHPSSHVLLSQSIWWNQS